MRWLSGNHRIQKWMPGTAEYDKEKLQERLAKLSGGVAILYVGAATREYYFCR